SYWRHARGHAAHRAHDRGRRRIGPARAATPAVPSRRPGSGESLAQQASRAIGTLTGWQRYLTIEAAVEDEVRQCASRCSRTSTPQTSTAGPGSTSSIWLESWLRPRAAPTPLTCFLSESSARR